MRDYSLWLLPPPREGAAWRALIRRLADAFDAPAFEPHVTLLGGIAGPRRQVVAAARAWAASVAPPTARPRGLAHLDEYYRCVFVELEKTPELLAARRRAETIFDRAGGDYFPHLSLLYGRFDAATKRRAIAAAANPAAADYSATPPDVSSDVSFDAPFALASAALVAMDAGGTPADWEAADSFSLVSS